MLKSCCVFALTVSTAFAQKMPDLPAPFATPSAANGPKIIARPDAAKFTVPAGFTVEEYAAGLQKPRVMLVGPGGEVLVTESVAKGAITVFTSDGKTRK